MRHNSARIKRHGGFTLIELMAVVLIICIMAGIVISIWGYVNRSALNAQAKAQMAAMQAALEAYKTDVGYYPVSTWERFSGSGNAEISNSACLYRALTMTNKFYYTGRQSDIVTVGAFTYFKDPWGMPWNYYNPMPPQQAALAVINVPGSAGNYLSYAYGGQMNPNSYDLFSFGPDGCTTIPGVGPTGAGYYWRGYGEWSQAGHDKDDITNWK